MYPTETVRRELMNTPYDRRRFLATLGLGTAAFAGCLDSLDVSDGSGGSDGDDGTNGGGTDDTRQVEPPAINDGEVIDDFEEVEWTPLHDHTTVSGDEEALVGEQSMLVESDDEDVAGAFYAFSEGRDFADRDLSFGVRIDSPHPARVVLEVHAPGTSDRLTSARSIPGEFDGWLRMDGGYTDERGEPNLGNVQELRIYVQSRGDAEGSIRFRVDDLRATDCGCSEQGKVVLTFDDCVESQYTTAFDMLEERGWPGVAAVIPDSLNGTDRLTTAQCRELRDAGWDVSAHPHTALPELDDDERTEYLQEAHDYLANRISEDGARHYFAPYNRMDADSLEDVREVFETSFIHGGQPNAVPPTDPHMTSRVNGYDLDEVTDLFDLAAEYNQLVVTLIHGIGDTDSDLNDITEADFETLLDEIASRDLDVVTVSELADD